MNCEICKKETDIEPKYCCSGKDCSCRGLSVNEGRILCQTCYEHVEYFNNYNASVIDRDGDEINLED